METGKTARIFLPPKATGEGWMYHPEAYALLLRRGPQHGEFTQGGIRVPVIVRTGSEEGYIYFSTEEAN